jgi:competence protein ComEC
LSENRIKALVGSEVLVQGVVSSDPVETRPKVFGSRISTSKTTFIMRLTAIPSETSLRIPVRVLIAQDLGLIPGERIELVARIIESDERKIAALLLGKAGTLKSLHRPRAVDSLEIVRTALREKADAIGGDSGALIPGMVIGDVSLQSSEFTTRMLNAGLSHLTAVSGANFAIVSAFLFTFIGFLIPNRRVQVITTVLGLAVFVLLVRPTPSVLRAAVMALVFLVAKLSGRKSAATNSLAIAISVLLLINPFQAFEAGFILSVLATSGLIFVAPLIARRIKGPKILGELVSIPMAATLFCSPYLMFLSGGMNLSAVPLNIAAAPAVPFVTVIAFIATIVALPLPLLAEYLLFLANIGTSWIVFLAGLSKNAPTFVSSPIILILAVAALLLLRKINFRNKTLIAIPIVVILALISVSQRLSFPGTHWRVGQCDVGQGDALLINLGRGNAALFDAGPDPKALDRCLDSFKVKSILLVVISHSHADHYLGLSDVGGRYIGEVWSNRSAPSLGAFTGPVREVKAGDRARVGDISIEFLWPESGTEEFAPVDGDGSAENNRSLVALVELAGKRILITGDIEPGAQQAILNRIPNLDLMKVPHHGSRHQDLALFQSAEIFLISVGNNSYGHPDEGLISHLASLGRVFRTDKDGAISLSWQGRQKNEIVSARRIGKEWWRLSWH